MTVDVSCLVAGDPVELEVRRRYSTWAAAARSVVRDLASDPARLVSWPQRPGATRAAPHLVCEPVADGPVARARREGWLVTDARPGPVGPRGPLAGVAVAVKDVIDVAGLPTGNGALGVEPRQPVTSATAWSVLASAGAWCVGKSATHEWAWGVTTPAIGNPHDPTRVAGGSSGGSAAAVAVGAAAAALATDTGGSIRIPAALCGVLGLRPTLGAVDTTGVTPLAPEQDVVGPMARSVEVLAVLLATLLGRPCLPVEDSVVGLRIGFLRHVGRLQDEVADDYGSVLRGLERSGALLVPLETALPRLASGVSLATMLASSARRYASAVRETPTAYGSATRALMTLGGGTIESEELALARAALIASTASLFAGHELDAVLTPTTPCVAPPRGLLSVDVGGRDEAVDAALTRFTAWSSATGLPAVATPAGRGPLPTSVQFMAPPHREDVCLRLARCTESLRLEQKRGQQ